jgi:hypothetical protein
LLRFFVNTFPLSGLPFLVSYPLETKTSLANNISYESLSPLHRSVKDIFKCSQFKMVWLNILLN